MNDIINVIESLHQDYKITFDSPSGQRVLKDLERLCYINDSTISNIDKFDINSLALKEGMRRVVLRIKQYSDSEMVSESIKKLKGTHGRQSDPTRTI
jgi:hypothetical protein